MKVKTTDAKVYSGLTSVKIVAPFASNLLIKSVMFPLMGIDLIAK